MSQVNALFERAKNGFEFFGETVREISVLMSELSWHHGMDSLVQLFRILDVLSHSREFHQLHNDNYVYKLKEAETSRINIVYNYAARYFKRKITLEEVAALLNMTPTSLDRKSTRLNSSH